MHLRVDFVIRAADAHCVTMPRKIEILLAAGIPHVLIFGACDDQRLLVVMEDRRKKEFPVGENDFVLVTAQRRDLRALGGLYRCQRDAVVLVLWL